MQFNDDNYLLQGVAVWNMYTASDNSTKTKQTTINKYIYITKLEQPKQKMYQWIII